MPTINQASRIIPCSACGAKNRVTVDKIESGLAPVCGRCGKQLDLKATGTTDNGPVVVTDANFSTLVTQSPLPVLLDMWAPWCGPCRMIAPTIEALAAQMGHQVRFGKLNVDENPRTAGQFNVSSIPTLLILKSGREVDRIVGLQSADAIRQRLQRVL